MEALIHLDAAHLLLSLAIAWTMKPISLAATTPRNKNERLLDRTAQLPNMGSPVFVCTCKHKFACGIHSRTKVVVV